MRSQVSKRESPFVICGDDLCGIWPENTIRAYERIMEETGAQFSAGKHYTSTKYGVFTEELFAIECRRRTRYEVQMKLFPICKRENWKQEKLSGYQRGHVARNAQLRRQRLLNGGQTPVVIPWVA